MGQEVRGIFERLEQQKSDILARVSGWDQAKLAFRPRPASWSALDVLDHLVRVEQTAIAAVLSNLPDGRPVHWSSRISGAVVNQVMRSRIRVRVPRGVESVIPAGEQNLDEICARWCGVRSEMQRLLAGFTQTQLQRGLVRHPIAGWMTIGQGMTFLSAHLKHHGYQLDRLEKAARQFAETCSITEPVAPVTRSSSATRKSESRFTSK